MKIVFSRFSTPSYDAVLTLWKQCEGIGLSDADSRVCIQGYLNHNPGMSFIACSGESVVGAILAGHDGRRGYIHHLAVAPGFRLKGIARQLVNRSLSALREAGIQKCHIFIFINNTTGNAFWRAVGWTPRSDIGIFSKGIDTFHLENEG